MARAGANQSRTRRDPIGLASILTQPIDSVTGICDVQSRTTVQTVAAGASTLTPEEFVDWVRPHSDAMSRLAARLAAPGDRDDVVQSALERAWKYHHRYDASRGTVAAWLLAITANQARRSWRLPGWGRIGRLQARVHALDERMDLEFAISRLPDRQRLAIDCYYFVDLTISETAAVMGCSEGTVKSTLFDARRRLKGILESGDE